MVGEIDFVNVPGGGRIGMVPCPRDGNVQFIADSKADVLITLMEPEELKAYGVPDLNDVAAKNGCTWLHLPIPDMSAPDDDFVTSWRQHSGMVLDTLRSCGTVVIHCVAGLGRTGTVAASLLVLFGQSPKDAIAAVRLARPGAIETPAQERFISNQAAELGSH